MYELKVISKFAAAHQLSMVTEKCENLHGHNWRIEVYVAGSKLNEWGVLVDFGEIKRHLSDVMDILDHKFLNDINVFRDINPSSENIAKYIADQMQSRLTDPSIRVSRVRVWESDDACATYITQ
ncbi:MAG: 6-carboxytetrahydropterin synthase QueD [Desulfobacteraceae bacterium]|jgi:6-pyruvoyltetrahydropterin/6-carboxytetrahydropterin synthase|nr:MAG: 6-carboxytetrahydropterin synthase QueD [Desulfobacteraceae bacterium]